MKNKILDMNGYCNLDCNLRIKFDEYLDANTGENISSFFTWEEFCQIFVTTTFIFYFRYEGAEYSIGKEGNLFSIIGKDEKIQDVYKSPQELLNNAKINNKMLYSIWNSILIN